MITSSCHCGAVRLEIAGAPTELTSCNCSICRRIGGLWAYYRPDQVKLLGEREATIAYQWGDRTLELHSCRTCGCTTHWTPLQEGTERMGINARMLEPAMLAGLPIRLFDGADSWETIGWTEYPPYAPR